MLQKDKVGKPTPGAIAELSSVGPAGIEKEKAPDVLRPRCMSQYCIERREKGEKHPDGTQIGDPLEMLRLRYDFEDGVVAETLFCKDCRQIINATMYGLDRLILERLKREAAAKVPEPPAAAAASVKS